jgi:hypothetical protein
MPNIRRTSDFANIPASVMKPGQITETPTPLPWRSARSACAKPRMPNFVALYMELRGVAALPLTEDM